MPQLVEAPAKPTPILRTSLNGAIEGMQMFRGFENNKKGENEEENSGKEREEVKECSRIAKICEHDFNKACRDLRLGAIIIGEYHGLKFARMFLLDLIDANVVKELFLEVPSLSQDLEKGQEEIEEDKIKVEPITLCNLKEATLDYNLPEDYKMPNIIKYCLSKRIRIHYIDLPGSLRNGKPESPSEMQRRDRFMSQYYNKYVWSSYNKHRRSDKHDLIFVGSRHVESIARKCGIRHTYEFAYLSAVPRRIKTKVSQFEFPD
jgi:hypothetical protein